MLSPNISMTASFASRGLCCDGFFSVMSSLFTLFFLRFYLFIHKNTQRGERERQRHRQREKQAPFRKPDMGLDPGPPGSHPGLQVALNRWATGAAQHPVFIRLSCEWEVCALCFVLHWNSDVLFFPIFFFLISKRLVNTNLENMLLENITICFVLLALFSIT